MNPSKQILQNRSVQLIFRDCLKLASRMVQDQNKVIAVRALLRREFEKNRDVYDQDKIHALKMNAVKGISNYIIYTVQKDHNLLNKKEVNIFEEEDQLQHRQ